MKEYIMRGDERAVAQIIQENKIRINRGEVTFTPVEQGEDAKDISIADSKDVAITDDKTTKRKKK